MIRFPDKCYLEVGGQSFDAWLDLSVTSSIEHCASDFSMTITRTSPLTASPIKIPKGASCKVYIGDDLILTGYIDRVAPSHDATRKTVTVSGRAKTADAVDCSIWQSRIKPATWKNVTIVDIARQTLAPYGIQVQCEVFDLLPIKRATAEVGDTVFSLLERLARDQRLLLTDTPEGDLLLTRVGSLPGWVFLNPGNIKSGSAFADISERFSRYVVRSQCAGDDQDWGELVSGIEAEVQDDSDIDRFRLLVVNAEKSMNAADAERRAKWEALTRAGRSTGCTLTVCGWRGADGAVFRKNTLCQITDIDLDIDGLMLLVQVEYRISQDEGVITNLTFAPAEAYEPEPPKSQASQAKKITKSSKLFEVAGGVK